VQRLPVKGYNAVFQAPVGNSKTEGYVTVLDKYGREMPEKSLPLSRKIRDGYNDLQNMTDYVNDRIEKLLSLHGGHEEVVPKACAVITCKTEPRSDGISQCPLKIQKKLHTRVQPQYEQGMSSSPI
jgi:hypothetical protein